MNGQRAYLRKKMKHQKYNDKEGRNHQWWQKLKYVSIKLQRIGALLKDLGPHIKVVQHLNEEFYNATTKVNFTPNVIVGNFFHGT